MAYEVKGSYCTVDKTTSKGALYGIDLSPKMVEVAKAKKIKSAEFICDNCENLSFPDNSFDAITCSMSFPHPYPVDFLETVNGFCLPAGD